MPQCPGEAYPEKREEKNHCYGLTCLASMVDLGLSISTESLTTLPQEGRSPSSFCAVDPSGRELSCVALRQVVAGSLVKVLPCAGGICTSFLVLERFSCRRRTPVRASLDRYSLSRRPQSQLPGTRAVQCSAMQCSSLPTRKVCHPSSDPRQRLRLATWGGGACLSVPLLWSGAIAGTCTMVPTNKHGDAVLS